MELSRAKAVPGRHRQRNAIFAQVAEKPRSMFDSVRRRLVLVVLLAMAPIAVLNFAQSIVQLSGAEEEARQHLLKRAIAAAGTQESVFASAENVLYALKNVEEVRNAGASCQATLRGATLSLPFAANIGVLDASGRVLCSALPVASASAGASPWFQNASAQNGYSLSGRVHSPAAGRDVVLGSLPLRTPAGALERLLVIGIDIGWLDAQLRQQSAPSTGVVALFSASGEELVSNSRAVSTALFGPEARAGLSRGTGLGESTDARGTPWTYATADIEGRGLTVAFAMPSSQLFGWTFLATTVTLILPAVIIALSLVALWIAVDRIILRWLLYLRRVTAVYAQGHYGFRPTRLDAAPSEFRALGHAVENMALAVRLRDARLRENLAEKTALVREIHHRIKNSLQVVVSLLSLYGSGVRGEDRRRFEQLRTRVNTLALVHRILYEASDGSQVQLRELLGELASLLEGSAEGSTRITVEAQDVRLPTDMAVPLALMVVELVLSIAVEAGPPAIALTADVTGDRLSLTLRCPDAGTRDPADSLASGFASQLGGTLSRQTGSDGALVIMGDFPCRLAVRPR